VSAVFDEIRAAELYLATPSATARDRFQAAADDAFDYERRLENLGGLSNEDRLTVIRIKQLQASIQVDYALAHALKDLGREREAQAEAVAVREPTAELTRLVRDLSSRQAVRAAQAGDRLAAASRQGERILWLVLTLLVVAGGVLSFYTLRWVEAPLGRLVTAAERFGAGDLRPVTTGRMPREVRVLADALQQVGEGGVHSDGRHLGRRRGAAGRARVDGVEPRRAAHRHGPDGRAGRARSPAGRGDPHRRRPPPGRRGGGGNRPARRAGSGADDVQ